MTNMTTADQIKMFDCEISMMQANYEEQSEMGGVPMMIMSEMSDAQHQMSLFKMEEARRTLNRAKWYTSKVNATMRKAGL